MIQRGSLLARLARTLAVAAPPLMLGACAGSGGGAAPVEPAPAPEPTLRGDPIDVAEALAVLEPRAAELSFYLAPERRGGGLGPALLQHATAFAFKNGFETIRAEARASNLSSIHSFLKAGYQDCGRARDDYVSFEARRAKPQRGEEKC